MKNKGVLTKENSQSSKTIYRQIVIFFGLTFLISWGVLLIEMIDTPFKLPNFLLILVGFGPALAALGLVAIKEGWSGLGSLLSRLGIIQVGWGWYVIVLVAPAVLFLSALGIASLAGIQTDLSNPTVLDLIGNAGANPWILIIPAFIYLLLSLLGEEIGWRGYALPRLLIFQNETFASLILGLLWGVWHLPMAWVPSLQAGIRHLPLGWFLVDIIAMSMLYTWIFVNTRGSLLVALFLHAANNLAAMYLPVLPPAAPGNQIFFLLMALKWVLVFGILINQGVSDWKISN